MVIEGDESVESIENLAGAGSSCMRLRRSTNSLFHIRSLSLGGTNESIGLARVEVSCLPGNDGKTTSASTCSGAGGWMTGGWMTGGWMTGGWMTGGWMTGGWMSGVWMAGGPVVCTAVAPVEACPLSESRSAWTPKAKPCAMPCVSIR